MHPGNIVSSYKSSFLMKTTNNQHTQMQCNSNSYNPKHGEFLQSWRRFPSVKSAQTVNWSTSVLKVFSSKTFSLKPSLNCQFCSRSELAGGEYWPWRPAERRRLGWPPEEDPSGHQELHCCTHYTLYLYSLTSSADSKLDLWWLILVHACVWRLEPGIWRLWVNN